MTSPRLEGLAANTRTLAEVLAERCPECNGKGFVRHWVFRCRACHGTGKKDTAK